MKTTREKVLALHVAEPSLNRSEIAKRLGVSRQRVSAIVATEGITTETGKRGIGGRPRTTGEDDVGTKTRDEIVTPSGTSPSAAVLLAAADLARRGYAVFSPITKSPPCELVAIDGSGRAEQIVVERKRGKAVRYDTPENDRKMRRALILTDEPVQYLPALRAKD
jgi:hypothetical protein